MPSPLPTATVRTQVPVPLRFAADGSYLVAAQMLHALGVSRVALLSNYPDKGRSCAGTG